MNRSMFVLHEGSNFLLNGGLTLSRLIETYYHALRKLYIYLRVYEDVKWIRALLFFALILLKSLDEYSRIQNSDSKFKAMTSKNPFQLEGNCDCKHIRYRLEAKPLIIHCCHCRCKSCALPPPPSN